MKELLKKILFGETTYDRLIEGVYAHQYEDLEVRKEIQEKYKERWTLVINPSTKPELYDPLNPPKGWIYDPYYELWIQVSE